MEEQFRITREEISKTNKEVAQVKDGLGKLSLGTPEGREQEKGEFKKVMEGKMEDMERRLVKCVETQCEKQGVLLREQGGRICSLEADRAQVGPVSQGGVGGLPDAGGVHAKLGEGRGRGVFWPNAGTRDDCSDGCAECESDGLGE